MKSKISKLIAVFTLILLIAQPVFSSERPTLTKVVVLSRHSIRSPLSDRTSALGKITPHKWFEWTSRPSELSRRGALLETTMGQYFRLWLESEGLFPENYIPQAGAVRFYANGLQRTQATARYFSAGLLPVSQVPIERHVEYNKRDDTFLPQFYFLNDKYAEALKAELVKIYGGETFPVYREKIKDAVKLMVDVLDVSDKADYLKNVLEGPMDVKFEYLKEPTLVGEIKIATSIADALVLQYYEEEDELKAAFGHKLSFDDWKKVGSVLGIYQDLLFTSPLTSINVASPMIKEIYSELNQDNRKFSYLCGHDSTIASVLAALGVKNYNLPNAIEATTPIGVKLVFERWEDKAGEAFYKIKLVYQSLEQLRELQQLSLENPPTIVPVFFKELEADEQGFVKEEKLLELFKNKINSFEELKDIFPEEKEIDDAA